MKQLVDLFNEAMDLACLGIFEKKQALERDDIFYSKLLKKSIDKFVLLNFMYTSSRNNKKKVFPSDETQLIRMLNNNISEVIDNMPEGIKEELKNTDWYYEDALIRIGRNNCFYCTENLLDSINNTMKFNSVKEAKEKELELASYYFIERLFEKTQEEYCEIRNFLEQKKHSYITGTMYRKNEYIKEFKKKYKDIYEEAYEKLNYKPNSIKICRHCGLVLRELADGTLYCVSDRCSQKTKGFAEYDEIQINDEILVLKENVARYIYYPGLLEQEIKRELNKNGITPIMWPKKDRWDFEFEFRRNKWVVDAKDIKNPMYIIKDIANKEKLNDDYDKVIYIVPSDKRKEYLMVINNSIENKQKFQCITLAEFRKIFL